MFFSYQLHAAKLRIIYKRINSESYSQLEDGIHDRTLVDIYKNVIEIGKMKITWKSLIDFDYQNINSVFLCHHCLNSSW